MGTDSSANGNPMKFESILQLDVPKGRDGKHKKIVTQLLSDIDQLAAGTALKIPLCVAGQQGEHPLGAKSRNAAQRH